MGASEPSAASDFGRGGEEGYFLDIGGTLDTENNGELQQCQVHQRCQENDTNLAVGHLFAIKSVPRETIGAGRDHEPAPLGSLEIALRHAQVIGRASETFSGDSRAVHKVGHEGANLLQ